MKEHDVHLLQLYGRKMPKCYLKKLCGTPTAAYTFTTELTYMTHDI